MKDALKKLVEFLFNGHASSVDSVTKDILDFSADTSKVVSDISGFAVMPVALTVLAIVMMVELNRKASHIEADHQTGVKLIAAVIFKYIILVMAVKNSGILLNAIRALVANVMGDPHLDPEGAGVSVNENGAAVSAFQASIDKASSVDQVGMLIFLLIPFLVTRPVVAGAHCLRPPALRLPGQRRDQVLRHFLPEEVRRSVHTRRVHHRQHPHLQRHHQRGLQC